MCALEGTRTPGLQVRNLSLYPLSYERTATPARGRRSRRTSILYRFSEGKTRIDGAAKGSGSAMEKYLDDFSQTLLTIVQGRLIIPPR